MATLAMQNDQDSLSDEDLIKDEIISLNQFLS